MLACKVTSGQIAIQPLVIQDCCFKVLCVRNRFEKNVLHLEWVGDLVSYFSCNVHNLAFARLEPHAPGFSPVIVVWSKDPHSRIEVIHGTER